MSQVVFDTEVYSNYFLIAFKKIKSGESIYFDCYPGKLLDIINITKIINKYELISFNGNNFDLPVLSVALTGASIEKIKQVCDLIITQNKRPWELEKHLGITFIKLNHIDLIEVAIGKCSLKAYGGRLHSKRLQDLPIEPDALIQPEDRQTLIEYCINDLDTTIDLYKELKPQIDLRRKMSNDYGLDLRSKSDAQIAEAVIRQEVVKHLGYNPKKSIMKPGTQFFYDKPEFIKFRSEQLNNILCILKENPFVLQESGVTKPPEQLENLKISIGNSTYQLGIGGLHSCESERYFKTNEEYSLHDFDVASYYPSIILNNGLYPENLTSYFLEIYRKIRDDRIEAKRSGNKVVADALKITLNGSFGKFGSKYSILYSPKLLIQTTITGQLALLMLIEKLEEFNIQVVSANTDGIVIYCPVNLHKYMYAIIKKWEKITGFETEETKYQAIYSRDVNNYIAIKDGGIKVKGEYAKPGLAKNPQNEICSEVVCEYLKSGKPIEETIRECGDVRKFVTVRQVKGGAIQGDKYLGKVVRWVYGADATKTINYKTNGNLVPKSEGAVPLMTLPDVFPDYINYDWYIKEAQSMLMDLGVLERPVIKKLPRKNSKEWKLLLESGKIGIDIKGKGYWRE